MGWLINYTLASIATAFIVVKIFDYVFAGVANSLVSIARVFFFVAAWTLVTAQAGMHSFRKRVRQLRQGTIRKEGSE